MGLNGKSGKMIELRQDNPKWAMLKLGKSGHTMSRFGCYVTALASLLNRQPDEFLSFLNDNDCFDEFGLLNNVKVAKLLNMKYHYENGDYPGENIACTNFYYKLGFPQHFFLKLADGRIMDPLYGKVMENHYKIVSTRVWENGNVI